MLLRMQRTDPIQEIRVKENGVLPNDVNKTRAARGSTSGPYEKLGTCQTSKRMEAVDGADGSLQGELSTVIQSLRPGRWVHGAAGTRLDFNWPKDAAHRGQGLITSLFSNVSSKDPKEIVEAQMRRSG
jgi:hypothetical protein